MSSLLKMAQDAEQKLKAQASDTEQMLKREFSAHERSVSEALQSSEQKISDAISGFTLNMTHAMQLHNQRVLRMTGRTWLTITLVTALLLATCSGTLWYQGREISANLAEISQQREALEALKEKTWGVTYQEEKGERYLVLPAGTSGNTGWTVGEGRAKRNAIRLEKE